MNRKCLSICAAALGLTSYICISGVSAWAGMGMKNALIKLAIKQKCGFVKNNKDGTTLLKLKLSSGTPTTRRLSVDASDEVYRMKKLNTGGYGFQKLSRGHFNGDVGLDSGDGLAIYTTSKNDFKKLVKVVPGTNGVKVLTQKETSKGEDKVSIYALRYPSNGSSGTLEKQTLTVNRRNSTSSLLKSKLDFGSGNTSRSLTFKTGINPDEVLSKAIWVSLD